MTNELTAEEAIQILDDMKVKIDVPKQAITQNKRNQALDMAIKALEQQTMGHCKDCRWWKDSDGAYRRDVGAESQCPINCQEVYKGNGYCFMYVPQESEDKE